MNGRLARSLGIVVACTSCCASPALACPVCDSEAGGQVRAGIAGDAVATGLLATLLPFALAAGLVAVVHLGGHSRRRPGDGGDT